MSQALISLPAAYAITNASSLDSYIHSANSFPILSHEEELRLARQYKNENNLDAARQLVLSHLRVVIAIARGYLGYGLPHADLIQEGNIGLMKAVKRFDPERGVRLVTFAIHWIKAQIHEYVIRNWRLVKIATTKAQRKLFFNLRSLKENLEQFSRDEIQAVAKQLKVKPEEVSEMEQRFAGQDVTFDALPDDDDKRVAPINYLTNPNAEPSHILETEQLEQVQNEGLKKALATLDPRSRRIVEARWLQEKDAATLHDLAAEFKVSAERIRQIEQKAMEKMKGVLLLPA